MHNSAMESGKKFANTYCGLGMKILDVGGLNINGSLRSVFEDMGCSYISLDTMAHPSVDVVCAPQDPFPFDDSTFDAAVSTSCFEHDTMFWMTFRDMCRVVKVGGFLYMNAPSTGPYHGYPGDCWRFYADAGKALESWSHFKIENKSYPVELICQYFEDSSWKDNICIWKKL